MIPSNSPGTRGVRRPRRTSLPLVAAAVVLATAVGAACGGGGAAPRAERADALDDASDDASDDAGDEGDAGGVTPTSPDTIAAPDDTSGGSPGFTAAAEALIASAEYADGCPLFTDLATIMAPYGEVTSASSGPDTALVDGAEVPEAYCNVGTSGGTASFSLVVIAGDASAILDAELADPNVAGGTITPVPMTPSPVVGGSVAGACIEDAEVLYQCRYVWSNGAVALQYGDLTELDPATAAAVLEFAVAELQHTIL
ncbi:MAG: hypothetical protein ACK5CE_18395 [Actinomycetes bacterium]